MDNGEDLKKPGERRVTVNLCVLYGTLATTLCDCFGDDWDEQVDPCQNCRHNCDIDVPVETFFVRLRKNEVFDDTFKPGELYLAWWKGNEFYNVGGYLLHKTKVAMNFEVVNE